MNASDIAPQRMRRQHLWGPQPGSVAEVVGWLGAVQSQEFPLAKWSLAQRTKGADNAAVDRAFADGKILRTHILRPTWHFVLPEDIRWMLALTAPRVNRTMATYDRQLELDPKIYAKTNRLIARAVAHGHLMRSELGDVLERAKIPARGQRLNHIVMHAELDGIVCSGAPRGKKHTYALIDERAPTAKTFDRADAIVELARRYFAGHGPATMKDFSWWSSLPMADVRRGLEELSKELEHEVVDGRTYWFASSPRVHIPRRRIDLVQVYDESLVAYTESRDAMLGAAKNPGMGALTLHVILGEGRLTGYWRTRPAKDAINVEVSLFRRLDAAGRDSLKAAVDRYGKFMRMPATFKPAQLPPQQA